MSIPLVWSDAHREHAPSLQTVDGAIHPHPEVPARPGIIREALVEAGLVELVEPRTHDEATIDAVHSAQYRSFLQEACAEMAPGEQVTPAGASRNPVMLESDRLPLRASYYASSTDAPLMRATYAAACSAVDVGLTGAELLAGGAPTVIALCRPPGHHAEQARMGGFCYFNNAVIAAHRLTADGRVAILDIDYHHGNGSQHLTYHRADVLYVSLHADPSYAYPGFSGRADEKGEGQGEGFNHNFPLPPHTAIDGYLRALGPACDIIAEYAPAYLIVSLGFDTHEEDPIGVMDLKSEDFGRLGECIAQLNAPALHVLEGGYALNRLGESAVAYFSPLA